MIELVSKFSIKIFLWFIRVYQLCISPLTISCCKFRPTCSEYAKDALHKYGIIIGCYKIILRIAKCNPWNKGGVDEA
jgi:putative membrane protein insertion efficiency factor